MTLNEDGITGILKISGTLDIDSAAALRESLLGCFLRQAQVTADLSEVEGCDTAAFQVLVATQRMAVSLGKTFRVTAASSRLLDTAAGLGFPIGVFAGPLPDGDFDAA